MSPASNVLHELEVIGATIRPAGDQLVLRAGAKPVPASVIRLIREQKRELLTLFRRRGDAVAPTAATFADAELNIEPAPETWTDAEEDRAAIMEYDGYAPRAWAEGFARLDPNKPPADVSAPRWLRFIDDCGRFLDGGWAARAAALGWGPLDLFGCDRERPFAGVDHPGLLWLVNGGSILELHRDHAIVVTDFGAQQTYRRRPVEVGRVVLAWELSA
jgi:hypothetical protein